MHITLTHNPFLPKTFVEIEGEPSNSMFDIFYPVNHFPLQVWLRPNGAWGGIQKALDDIRRGRVLMLTFCGRLLDFQDIEAALRDTDITLCHREAFCHADEAAFIRDMLEKLRFLLKCKREDIARRAAALLSREKACQFVPTLLKSPSQLGILPALIKNERGLMLIEAKLCEEAFPILREGLCDNFIRPSGSVAFVAHDSLEAERLAHICEYPVVTEGSAEYAVLVDKFSFPAHMENQYSKLAALLALMDELTGCLEPLKSRNTLIRGDDAFEQEYECNSTQIRWIQLHLAQIKEISREIRRRVEEGQDGNI